MLNILKICLTARNVNSAFIFTEGVHIWHNGYLWCVDSRRFQITNMTFESKVKVKNT